MCRRIREVGGGRSELCQGVLCESELCQSELSRAY